jgi:hypothetical protein
LGTVGGHLLPVSSFANCVFRAAEARRTLRTLYVAKSYGMVALSVSQIIRPCLRMPSSLVEVSVFGVLGLGSNVVLITSPLICVGFMGSPSVGSERIRSGEHLRIAGNELARYCGVSEFCATLWYVENFFEGMEN